MSSRERVFGALRALAPERVPLPPLSGDWIEYPDPVAQFRLALGRAAGELVVTAPDGARAALAELSRVKQAARCCSLIAGVPGNVPAPSVPHDFRDVDVVIVAAALGVAENGAVWLDERAAPVRAGLFLAQHLVVLLERAPLVHNLHQAYALLGATLGRSGYGCFVSGPSKTADIEQALIVGAHGPRSLTVVMEAPTAPSR